MKGGGGMVFELIAILVAAVLLCSWGIWKYSNAETNAYNQVLTKVRILESKVSELELDQDRQYRKLCDVKDELMSKSPTNQTVTLTTLAPISVEIIETAKKVVPPRASTKVPTSPKKPFKHIKKQMKELSQ